MRRLTRIEKLDQQYPGLADSVRDWFNQGISSEKVKELIREKYGFTVGRWDVGYFRTERWVPERELLRRNKMAALVAEEMAALRTFPASRAIGSSGH